MHDYRVPAILAEQITEPTRVLFLFSNIFIMIMVPLRFACTTQAEDIFAVMSMVTIAPYFLFFCRGFKTVGPFVVMIYKMIKGDLLRFVTIYSVFIMGFAQSYYIIFLSYKKMEQPPEEDDKFCTDTNPIPTMTEAILAMFIMSLNKYDAMYSSFRCTNHETLAKVMFVTYMAIVTILLINMLIAMMGNTYTKIAETRNEWQRQWARIVLVVERGVSPKERLIRQRLYSQPMADGKLAFIIRHQHTDEDKEELKELQELRANHARNVSRRLKGSNFMSSVSLSPKPLEHGSSSSLN
ncbi:unnamed protein product [Darwinula stevensoni]|uniref:Ion transport domain-containing protein n=1 Tax=Darwinula stevensoni TaxID=69355 RepID=A0A7R9FTQ1_9CRUS|nr:unnamed protein product [Darwinula stevensoni]CAG0905234.1 unnamed protein product [Darwinula stevensoni]